MDTRFDELLDFPCFQTFKVMGVAHEDLPQKEGRRPKMR